MCMAFRIQSRINATNTVVVIACNKSLLHAQTVASKSSYTVVADCAQEQGLRAPIKLAVKSPPSPLCHDAMRDQAWLLSTG